MTSSVDSLSSRVERPCAGLAANTSGHPLAVIDGWGVTVATRADAVDAAIAATIARTPTSLVTLNLDHLVKLRRDEVFRAAYRAASIVTADGAPIVWLARAQGVRLTRTTGADLVVPIAEAAAASGLPIAVFGTSTEVLAQASDKLRARAPGLVIAHAESPPLGFDPASSAADAALDRIAASGARILFIALGAPKQEKLAARAIARGVPITCVSIGAALNFIAGAQRRAPVWVQRMSLEWAWRLASEPRRLFWRYAECAAVLADIAVIGPARRRFSALFRKGTA